MSNEWVMVPREPTEAMFSASRLQEWDTFEQEWRAMLDSAPAAPQQAEPARPEDMAAFSAELKADAQKAYTFFRSAGIIDENGGLTPEYGGPAMTDAQMEAATVSDEASQERAAIAYKRGYDDALNDCLRNGGEAWARSMFANGGEHIKPQEQAEPVATVSIQHFRNSPAMQNHDFDLLTTLPPGTHALYLHPPADEVQRLRDALKPFAAIDLTTNQAVDAMDVLRARRALEGK